MRTIFRVVCLIVATLLLAADPAGAAGFSATKAAKACPGSSVTPTGDNLVEVRSAILCLINRERGLKGLEHVERNAKLDAAAARHSQNMNERDFFDHDTPAGTTVEQRVKSAGYLAGASSFSVGENIAWGSGSYSTPLSTMRGWMNSKGHRDNILRRQWRHVGIGVDLGAPMRGYSGATYTTDFGTK